MKRRIYKEKPHGGFLPPKTRHDHVTDFIAHAMNMNVDLHKTFHRSTQQMDNILERKHFFFLGFEGRLDGAPFASLHFVPRDHINHYFFSFFLDVFSYIFSYTC